MTIVSIESLYEPALDTQGGRLDELRIRYYMSRPDESSGILVYESHANGALIVVDGYHRVESARRLGRNDIRRRPPAWHAG